MVGADVEELRAAWRRFADEECGPYSPLYAAIAGSVADDPELLALVAAAPPSGRQPNVLLAAVHDLILDGVAHPLADVYAGRADAGRAPALFRDLCLGRRDHIGQTLARRRTQTNEPGRSALLAVGLAVAADAVGEPVGLLDVGCSAGLNLLIDRYRIEYPPTGGAIGPPDAPVTIVCETRGPARMPPRLPTIAARLGVDRAPIDLTAADDARWLLACVWPDTGRLPRTAAAIEAARRDRPPVVAGDMVDDLDAALDRFDPGLAVVVVTTSACGYLDADQRRAFLDILSRRDARRRRAGDRPLAWLSVDMPGVVDVVPAGPVERGDAVMGLVTFEGGTPVGRRLAHCHPHGGWLRWSA